MRDFLPTNRTSLKSHIDIIGYKSFDIRANNAIHNKNIGLISSGSAAFLQAFSFSIVNLCTLEA